MQSEPEFSTMDQVVVNFPAIYGFPSQDEPGRHYVWTEVGTPREKRWGPIDESWIQAAATPASAEPAEVSWRDCPGCVQRWEGDHACHTPEYALATEPSCIKIEHSWAPVLDAPLDYCTLCHSNRPQRAGQRGQDEGERPWLTTPAQPATASSA